MRELKVIASRRLTVFYSFNFVAETKLTDQEWEFARNFMGRMAAVPDRNVFLLAGDVLGVSQLIENHQSRSAGTISRLRVDRALFARRRPQSRPLQSRTRQMRR
jgi:Catechol dioxygenase N terminus